MGSILSGWAYIALVDFSFGMEFFRWLCVFLLVTRETGDALFRQKKHFGYSRLGNCGLDPSWLSVLETVPV